MSDSPARRPASGSCCGGPRGGASVNKKHRYQRRPHPETGGGTYSRSMIPPGAFLRRRGWGTTGSSHRYAMRKLRTQAICQVRPRARDPRRGISSSRSTRSLGSAGDAPPPAGGEGSSLSTLAPQFPPLRRRLAGDGFRTGFAASVPFAAASPLGVAGASIGAAIYSIALSSLRP